MSCQMFMNSSGDTGCGVIQFTSFEKDAAATTMLAFGAPSATSLMIFGMSFIA